MFSKIYSILTEILGESKQGYYDNGTFQYQFNCPRCAHENSDIPDGKFNLEVSLLKMKFKCWKCESEYVGMQGNLGLLVKKYGGSELYREFKDELIGLKESALCNFDLNSGITISTEDITLKLPSSYRQITDINKAPYKVKNYLIGRNITQDIIDKFNIGYTVWDDDEFYWRNKIIVPSYDKFGELNYFVGRDYSGKAKAKYKNCNKDKKEIIFEESLINWDTPIVLVEGVFDSLVFPNTISMLGKILIKDSVLFKELYKKANSDIIIVLDGDTTIDETKHIYNALNFGRLRNKIYYIDMSKCKYKDFSELFEKEGKFGIINAIRKRKQFKEIDLIF